MHNNNVDFRVKGVHRLPLSLSLNSIYGRTTSTAALPWQRSDLERTSDPDVGRAGERRSAQVVGQHRHVVGGARLAVQRACQRHDAVLGAHLEELAGVGVGAAAGRQPVAHLGVGAFGNDGDRIKRNQLTTTSFS